jgi:hypothetical protein
MEKRRLTGMHSSGPIERFCTARDIFLGFEFRLSDEREGAETMGMTYGTSFAPTGSESFDAHQGPRFSSNHRHRIRHHRCSHPRERAVGRVCRRPCPCQHATCSVMLFSPGWNEDGIARRLLGYVA